MSTIYQNSTLGQSTPQPTTYDPHLLYPIARELNRSQLQLKGAPPFYGQDIWNAYELSWLNPKGKPQVAWAECFIPAHSRYLIESKSLKLYLNSFNDSQFADKAAVASVIAQDLSTACAIPVRVHCHDWAQLKRHPIPTDWICLDHLDILVDKYQYDPSLLAISHHHSQTKVYSHLLKSNCLVTGQPDWGTIMIEYHGPTIEPASLLRYLISFRQHQEFHEHCVERIFMDLWQQAQPQYLSVYARYTRRGGLDINPYRSSMHDAPANHCLARQ